MHIDYNSVISVIQFLFGIVVAAIVVYVIPRFIIMYLIEQSKRDTGDRVRRLAVRYIGQFRAIRLISFTVSIVGYLMTFMYTVLYANAWAGVILITAAPLMMLYVLPISLVRLLPWEKYLSGKKSVLALVGYVIAVVLFLLVDLFIMVNIVHSSFGH